MSDEKDVTIEKETRITQVTNLSHHADLEQVKTLFEHLGIVETIKIYPKTM